MKAKAILTEGRRDIISYLEKRNDKWASPVKVFKEAKTGLGYGGTLKALKELYEEGFIDCFDLNEGEEKPRYKFRCRQDLSGFKNLTNAVIDTGDVAFFIKYTSTPYFDKWCDLLMDDVVEEGYNNYIANDPISGEKIYFSHYAKMILKLSPSALKFTLKKMDNEVLESILALSFSTFGKSTDECADKGGKLRSTFFCELIHKALTVDSLLNPALIEEAQKHFARK